MAPPLSPPLVPNGQNIQVPVITIKWLLCFITDSFISLEQDLSKIVKVFGKARPSVSDFEKSNLATYIWKLLSFYYGNFGF